MQFGSTYFITYWQSPTRLGLTDDHQQSVSTNNNLNFVCFNNIQTIAALQEAVLHWFPVTSDEFTCAYQQFIVYCKYGPTTCTVLCY